MRYPRVNLLAYTRIVMVVLLSFGICDRSGTTADANDRRPDTGRSYLNMDFLLGEPPARAAGVVQRGRTVLWRLWGGSASGIILPVLNVRGGVN